MANGVTPAALEAALAATPDARAAWIVSPTYYGMAADVAGCAAVCEAAGVPLVVDQSWGSHFGFHPDLPPSALQQGADAVLTSTHKIVGSLTQSAMLHVAPTGRIDPDAVARAVRLARSTSPSSLLMASLDAARRQLVIHGQSLLSRTIAASARAREAIDGDDALPRRRRGARRPSRASPAGTRCGSSSTCARPAAAATRSRPPCARPTTSTSSSRRTRRWCSCSASHQPEEALESFAHDFATTVRRIERPGDAEALVRASGALVNEVVVPPREAFLGRARRSSRSTPRSGASRPSRSRATRRASRRCCRASASPPRRSPTCASCRARARGCTAPATPPSARSSCSATSIDRARRPDRPRAGRGRRRRRRDDRRDGRRGRAGAGDDHPEGAGRDLRPRRSPRRCSRRLDPDARIERLGPEGEWREAGAGVLAVEGSARALLTAERTALNFLGRLSGIATLTAQVVARVREAGGTVQLLDTRKTTPGLRRLEKAAVAAGGGVNHRAGLYDAILIKENHSALAGGVGVAVRRALAARPDLPLSVEVRDGAEIDEALAAGAPRLLLDNMTPQEVVAAVALVAGRAEIEVSGGVTPDINIGLCDHRWARLHLDGRAHPLCARPRPLSGSGGICPDDPALPGQHPRHAGRGTRARRRARRRHPRAQLPGARGPAGGRLRRRLARPLAARRRLRRRGDRLLRRALHGRDGLDPVPGQDRPAARPRRRLLAGRLDHRRPAARLEGQAPRRRGRDVRQHVGRGQGGDRLLRAPPPTPSPSSSTSTASTARTRRSCSGPTCSSAPSSRSGPGGRCTCGTASATSTPGSARATSPRCAPRTRAPTS